MLKEHYAISIDIAFFVRNFFAILPYQTVRKKNFCTHHRLTFGIDHTYPGIYVITEYISCFARNFKIHHRHPLREDFATFQAITPLVKGAGQQRCIQFRNGFPRIRLAECRCDTGVVIAAANEHSKAKQSKGKAHLRHFFNNHF